MCQLNQATNQPLNSNEKPERLHGTLTSYAIAHLGHEPNAHIGLTTVVLHELLCGCFTASARLFIHFEGRRENPSGRDHRWLLQKQSSQRDTAVEAFSTVGNSCTSTDHKLLQLQKHLTAYKRAASALIKVQEVQSDAAMLVLITNDTNKQMSDKALATIGIIRYTCVQEDNAALLVAMTVVTVMA